jgi:hypothetical protein
MFVSEQDESAFRVHYRSYRLGMLLLLTPPLMLYEFAPSVIDGSIERSALVGLIIGVMVPLLGAYYLVEFASFSFSQHDNQFCWRWRNLLRHKSLEIPLQRIVQVRRESLESGDSAGLQYTYRLVVVLDDESIVGLTHGYSRVHGKQLDQIVNQIREYLGHVVPLR